MVESLRISPIDNMQDKPEFDRKVPANRGVKPPAVPIREAVLLPIQIKSAAPAPPSPPSPAVTFPQVYNPLRRPSPLQPKAAPLAVAAWKPGTDPPVYRPLPHNARQPGALLPAVPIREAILLPIQIKSAAPAPPSPPSPAVTFPQVYNPLRRPSPLQPKAAPLAVATWKPGTDPPVYRLLPHNARQPGAVLQRKLTPESKSAAPARGIQRIRLNAPGIGPRPLVSAIQRATAAANEFTVVKDKRTEKLEKKQHAKASSGPRTLCDAWLSNDPDSAVQASSGLTLEAWKALSAKAPALADHISGTREKKETPAIACAEPQALALLLSTFGSKLGTTFTLGNIRISTALDQNTGKTKPPCQNCSTWLEVATGETDAYEDTAYRLRSAFR